MKERKMKDFKLIDSSVWIAYMTKKLYLDIINSEDTLLLSTLSIFEIKKKLTNDNIPKIKIDENIKFIKERCILIPVTTEIAEEAVNISTEKHIPAIDSLIYATARSNNAVIITLDNDFRNLKGATILD